MRGYVDLYSDAKEGIEVSKVCMYSSFSKFYFVYHNGELVSYGGEGSDRFYVNHFGKEIKGRVVEGRRHDVKSSGAEFEIEVKKGDFSLRLDYTPFGKRLTPYIRVRRAYWSCVILAEVGKVYKGREVNVVGKPWGVQVEQLSSDKFRVYMLTLDGRDCLLYEGDRFAYYNFYTPEFHKLGNVVIVEFSGVEQNFKKYFVEVPGFSNVFIHFVYKGKEKWARISFDLENWMEVKAGEMIFKKEEGIQVEDRIAVERWLSARTANEILEVIEKIKSHIVKKSGVELSPSLGG